MSNNTVTIDLILDRHSTKEVVRAVLHAILFHRLFGIVKPKTFEVFDVTVSGVDDPQICTLIEEKVDLFWKGIESGASKRGQITITLSEKRPRRTWFYMGEEEVPWERWIVNIELRQPKLEQDRQAFNDNIASTLTKALHTMLTHSSSERARNAVPPITNPDVSPFPLKIVVKVNGVEVGI